MNDRCAAGTGKFLELMARVLDYDLDDFGPASLLSSDTITINSMCAVFAESVHPQNSRKPVAYPGDRTGKS